MDLSQVDRLYFLTSPWICYKEIPEMDKFLSYGKKKIYYKNEIIFNVGEMLNYLYFLFRGRITIINQAKNGIEKTFWVMESPGIFGEVPFFHRYPSRCMAFSKMKSEVYLFDRETVHQEFSRHPQIMFYLLRQLAHKIRIMSFQMEDVNFHNPLLQVARFLFVMAYQNGKKEGEKYIIPERLSHQEIASIVGRHRVTVTRAINQLEQTGIVFKKRDKVVIPNLNRLYKFIIELEKAL